jgi:hypothetical protein
MRKSIVVAVLAASILLVVSEYTFACGESMFRVGKGVQYRAFSAPIPGSVLVYARTDSELAVAENLRLAGHQVLVVANDAELATEMRNQKFNVVVAPYSKREVVEEHSAQIASHPDWLPVVEKGSPDQRLARTQFGRVVTTDDDVRKYLKAIHKSLKNQGA